MKKNEFEKYIIDYANNNAVNFISAANAARPELVGMKIFDEPIFGYADADDPLFAKLKEPQVIGEYVLLPKEWLPAAKTVISVFFPFTTQVKESNKNDAEWPSDEWLHGRIEGQAFLKQLDSDAVTFLTNSAATLCPLLDPRFIHDEERFTSNWSERHAAYIAGLGTFGLSKGLITEKGVAGRFISLITACEFTSTPRKYSGLYEYCARCGACVKRCPAGAITLAKGKLHPPCKKFLEGVKAKYTPRYGCGKCQTGVPCENGIPHR